MIPPILFISPANKELDSHDTSEHLQPAKFQNNFKYDIHQSFLINATKALLFHTIEQWSLHHND